MPNYHYRCAQGCAFDAIYPMAAVPQEVECRVCGGLAKRGITAPHLSAAGSAAYGLIDRSAKSAHEPAVVDRLPGRGPGKAQRTTQNPLHAKLPRP